MPFGDLVRVCVVADCVVTPCVVTACVVTACVVAACVVTPCVVEARVVTPCVVTDCVAIETNLVITITVNSMLNLNGQFDVGPGEKSLLNAYTLVVQSGEYVAVMIGVTDVMNSVPELYGESLV